MTELDRLIHEPARLLLMTNLSVVDEADFAHLAARTGTTAGNLSSHLSRLEAAGYVAVQKAFVDRRPRTTYRLTEAGREAFRAYRAALVRILEAGDGDGSPAPSQATG